MEEFKKHLENEKESLTHNINELYKTDKTSKYYKRTIKSWMKHLKLINESLERLLRKPYNVESIKAKYIKAAK